MAALAKRRTYIQSLHTHVCIITNDVINHCTSRVLHACSDELLHTQRIIGMLNTHRPHASFPKLAEASEFNSRIHRSFATIASIHTGRASAERSTRYCIALAADTLHD
jgi:hypothetical protein